MIDSKRRHALQAAAAAALVLHRPVWAAADPDVIVLGAPEFDTNRPLPGQTGQCRSYESMTCMPWRHDFEIFV